MSFLWTSFLPTGVGRIKVDNYIRVQEVADVNPCLAPGPEVAEIGQVANPSLKRVHRH